MHLSDALLRDGSAGAIASFVTLAHCLSFSALIFAGDLVTGLPMALWGFMISTAVVTLLASLTTTLPPILAGPRNPAVAVMGVLAAAMAGAAAQKGLSAPDAARHVLVALSISSILTGLLIWSLGTFRLGQIVRYVPFPVIGGFLGASGLLLIVGGIKVAVGPFDTAAGATALAMSGAGLRLVMALVFALALLGLRRARIGAKALPATIVAAALLIDLGVWLSGAPPGWHLVAGGGVQGWSPLSSLDNIDWALLASAGVEIATIAGVSMAALMLDVSSLEVQRRAQADMDAEFRANGAANLALAAIGGLSVGHALNPSRLIDQLGGQGRLAGASGGLFVGALLVSGLDFAQLVPRPVLGGLLVFLGAGVLGDALKVPGRGSRLELGLTLLIMVAIIGLGYLTGIVLGIAGACLLFAARYSKIGVIRRHLTRSELAAPVERRPEIGHLLVEQGGRIHIFWLSGYLFFGSANGLFESVRQAVATRGGGGRRWVILDCAAVTGMDASAVLSFQKLGNWATTADVVLVFAGASPDLKDELAAAGLIGARGPAHHFESRSEALEWCEDRLVEAAGPAPDGAAPAAFEAWLGQAIGSEPAHRLTSRHLQRRELAPGEVLCALGAPADTIEIVVAGSVAVTVKGLDGADIRVRRMTGGTVVGEMGFFRGLPRAAAVVAEERAVVYVLRREAYEALKATEPELCAVFLEFIIRALSDRVEIANREIAALL